MSLTDKIKEVVLKDISRQDVRLITSYDKLERQLINGLLESGNLTESEIDFVLEDSIIKRARNDYTYLLNAQRKSDRPIYPDHDIAPEFLAYAIRYSNLSEEFDLNKIKFDHGQNYLSFAESYCQDNLISKLRQRLLNPEQLPKQKEEDYDPHPACPCGH